MKILFFCNHLPFFISHFYKLAKISKEKGYEVVVVASGQTDTSIRKLNQLGIRFINISMSRNGTNIFAEFKVMAQLYRIFRLEKPNVVQLFTIKPCIYGGLISRLVGIPNVVATVTGLGYAFAVTSFFQSFRKKFLILLYKFALKGRNRNVKFVFENKDDQNFFVDNNIVNAANTLRVWGAGVDLSIFKPVNNENKFNLEQKNLQVILPARMLKDKGVIEFIEAAENLKNANRPIDMILVGGTDPSNAASFTDIELLSKVNSGSVIWRGFQSDMPSQLLSSDIVCLPSYREGMPKALLEAMACAKPIITTDAPGCKEVIEHSVHGFIIPVKDSLALENAILFFLNNPEHLNAMGINSLMRARALFSDESIAYQYISLYPQIK